ncbi:MAG: DUF4399 domain-containing protein [Acidimicrobiia bacterium]|nr:DUF4399 domain-containing protein [Acidimicrobiia bacterium]
MSNRVVMAVAGFGLAAMTVACGGTEAPPASTTPAESVPAAAPADAAVRVFFVSPKNGDTIKPLSSVEFGSSGLTVAAVPKGELTPEQVRPQTIHYHLGTDTDCLPPGTVIPKADPWIHFGDGKNVIEMSLAPGPHRIAVQAGDDRHMTIAGLCEVIKVTVAP